MEYRLQKCGGIATLSILVLFWVYNLVGDKNEKI